MEDKINIYCDEKHKVKKKQFVEIC